MSRRSARRLSLLDIDDGHVVALAARGSLPEQVHVFDGEAILAVNAALAARRPLLVRGEPGTGKSQLARAVGKVLGRAFVHTVVDSRTEASDLLWHFDAVQRLAEAQLQGQLAGDSDEARENLREDQFLRPGVLWWAFDWASAIAQAGRSRTPEPAQPDGGDAANGTVVLVDEIDKAESDVPNGLLEALGAGEFTPFGRSGAVTVRGEQPPLVIVTTNEERSLPDAFLRRCLVLQLELPGPVEALVATLVARGRAHFADVDEAVLEAAARMVADDRRHCRDRSLYPLPGQAEYLDLARATRDMAPGAVDEQLALLERLRTFALRKHPRETEG